MAAGPREPSNCRPKGTLWQLLRRKLNLHRDAGNQIVMLMEYCMRQCENVELLYHRRTRRHCGQAEPIKL